MAQPDEKLDLPFPEIRWGFSHCFLVAPLHLKLPVEMLAEIQSHVDAECNNPGRIEGSRYLAGRIRHGEQLGATKSLPIKYKEFFCNLGRNYVTQLAGANGLTLNPRMQVIFGQSWIVKSRSGDYNPAHKHGGQLSGIIYTKVPQQVADPSNTDGKLHFLFGQLKEENLDFLGVRNVIPVVGDMYLFPAWLTHLVYPFEGEGERISYSFNLFVKNIEHTHNSSD
jgi:uncharacterized protein (TIGR02466 family)